MKRTGMILGMAVLVLSLSLAFTGCSDDGGDKNYLDTFGLNSSTTLSSAALSVGGITQANFDAINTAAGGGFRGWAIYEDEDGDEFLVLAWTGRSSTNYTAVRTVLGTGASEDQDGMLLSGGIYGSSSWGLSLATSKMSEDGISVDAGTMILYLGNI